MTDFAQEMAAKLREGGMRDVVVARHGGLPPRWMAYGVTKAGRFRQTTFYGERDWRSALAPLLAGAQ